MAKVTEYPRTTKMKDNDILLVDGPDGTRTILQTDASKQMGGEVIMVNETAGDSTKVVINTTGEDIELALMADLAPVEEDVEELKTQYELTLTKNAISGDYAEFSNGVAGTEISPFIVNINSAQGGSGWTGAKVMRCGKNLLDPDINSYKVKSSSTYRYINNVVPNGVAAVMSFRDKDTTVDVSGINIGFVANNFDTESAPNLFRWIMNNGAIQADQSNFAAQNDGTSTCGNVFIYPSSVDAFNRLFARYDIQVEIGTAITDFEPYAGDIYNISFPSEAGTVHSGVLNLTEGTLSVGSTTPVVYALDPVPVTVLAGHNTAWADCGSVEIKYIMDAAETIDGYPDLRQEVDKIGAQAKHILAVETVDGNLILDDLFEIGSIGITANGWTYSRSSSRIRTKEGTTIYLVPGDVVSLEPNSSMRFYIGWRTFSGGYGTAGRWITDEYRVEAAGYYVITVTNAPESHVSSVNDILQYLTIWKCVNLSSKARAAAANVIGINHRGYNYIAPENTIPAFELSKKMGFDYIETDVSFTRDNVPVLLHDTTIDRTSNGTGNITDFDFNDVRQYDFGSWKSAEYTGTKIPSLEELLQYCKFAGLRIFLELKSAGTNEANIINCINLVKKYGMLDAVTWISYSNAWLIIVKTNLPTARLGLLQNTVSQASVDAAIALKTSNNMVFLDAPLSEFTDEIISTLIENGIEGGCFTPNAVSAISENKFVKYITTNVLNVSEAMLAYSDSLVQ